MPPETSNGTRVSCREATAMKQFASCRCSQILDLTYGALQCFHTSSCSEGPTCLGLDFVSMHSGLGLDLVWVLAALNKSILCILRHFLSRCFRSSQGDRFSHRRTKGDCSVLSIILIKTPGERARLLPLSGIQLEHTCVHRYTPPEGLSHS